MASLIMPTVLVSSCCYDTTLYSKATQRSQGFISSYRLQSIMEESREGTWRQDWFVFHVASPLTKEFTNQESTVGTMEEDAYLLAHQLRPHSLCCTVEDPLLRILLPTVDWALSHLSSVKLIPWRYGHGGKCKFRAHIWVLKIHHSMSSKSYQSPPWKTLYIRNPIYKPASCSLSCCLSPELRQPHVCVFPNTSPVWDVLCAVTLWYSSAPSHEHTFPFRAVTRVLGKL